MVGSNAVAIVYRSTTCMQNSFASFAALFLWKCPPSPPSLNCLAEICTTTGHQPDPSGDLNAGSANTRPITPLLAFLGTPIFRLSVLRTVRLGSQKVTHFLDEGLLSKLWGKWAPIIPNRSDCVLIFLDPLKLMFHDKLNKQARTLQLLMEWAGLFHLGCANGNGSAVFKCLSMIFWLRVCNL